MRNHTLPRTRTTVRLERRQQCIIRVQTTCPINTMILFLFSINRRQTVIITVVSTIHTEIYTEFKRNQIRSEM